MPAPPPEPVAAPPAPKFSLPKIFVDKRKWTATSKGRKNGLGFTVIYRLEGNPDSLAMRVAIQDNRGNVIHAACKTVGNLVGFEDFVPDATAAGAPFTHRVEYQNPESGEWVPLFDFTPLEAG